MYGLNCSYYKLTFPTLSELLDDILSSGMDPNYEIVINGKCTGNLAIDLIQI
jgi:hypothetical protein